MQRPNSKNYFLKTFGCQMNVYDSERMTEALVRDGYSETDDIARADLVILNTCHIREKAVEKVYSDLGRIRVIKEARMRDGKETVIAVTGCIAQAEGAEITTRQPAVNLVIGPQSYHRLPELISRAETKSERIVETEFPGDEKFERMKAPRRVSSPSAFLTVQEGCDKFCTFCVVPYTRGGEFSRPLAKLEAEARELIAAGAKELVLLGQNVNAYHGEGAAGRTIGLAELIRRLANLDGLERIRYMTSHPRDMDDDLIAAHAEVPQLMPFLHLPIQSGSDRMLTAMNRKHKAAEYVDLIARVRKARPRYRAVERFHRRLSRRDRPGCRRHDRPRRGGRFCSSLFIQIQHAPRNACGRPRKPGPRKRQDRAAAAASGSPRRAADRLQRQEHGRRRPSAV